MPQNFLDFCETRVTLCTFGVPKQGLAESARYIAPVLGSPSVGWLSLQTLWDEIIESDPDLIE